MNQISKPIKTLRHYLRDRKRPPQRGTDWEDLLFAEAPHHARPQESLWRAVILQMITDALSTSKKPELQQCKRDALHWLQGYSRDFRLVCHYAGFDPAWMQERITEFLHRYEKDNQAIQDSAAASSYNTSSIDRQYGLHRQDFSIAAPKLGKITFNPRIKKKTGCDA